MSDRGFLFGDGIFTTTKVSDGVVEGYFLHLNRLTQQCEELLIRPPTIEDRCIKELIAKNKAQNGSWRLKILATGGCEPFKGTLESRSSSLLITLKRDTQISSAARPLKLGMFFQPLAAPVSTLKTLSYLDRLLVKSQAIKQGWDDCITQTEQGVILETSSCNVFWKSHNMIFTPDSSLPLLQGISLRICLEAFRQMGLTIVPCKSRLEDLSCQNQFFVCNSVMGPHPVACVDQNFFSTDPQFLIRLREQYQKIMLEYSLLN